MLKPCLPIFLGTYNRRIEHVGNHRVCVEDRVSFRTQFEEIIDDAM